MSTAPPPPPLPGDRPSEPRQGQEWVRTASAGAFNFNVSMTIASWALWLSVILTLGIGFLWALPLWLVLFVVQIWAHVKGAMMASRGEVFEYPFQIRILS